MIIMIIIIIAVSVGSELSIFRSLPERKVGQFTIDTMSTFLD